jgi:type III secretory pathway lipoprotein EscJ
MKLNEIYLQLLALFSKATLKQKILFALSSICVFLIVGVLFLYSLKSNYAPLYQENILSQHEKTERRHLLEEMGVPYRENKSGEIEVPKEDLESLRSQIMSSSKETKGFELFDSNTWIKGDKELQVLEMRALKGQLERDLMGFDSVKGARVSFDTTPEKKFATQSSEAKASVILTLHDHSPLSWTQLHAITAHLAGAVRGLEPHMIAVSDTQGRLYQIPDKDAESQPSRIQKKLAQEKLQANVRTFLDRILGQENYHLTLDGDEERLSISLCYDERAPFLEEELSKILTDHLKPLTQILELDLSSLPFYGSPIVEKVNQPLWGFFHVLLFLFFLMGAPILYFFHYYHQRKSAPEEEKLTKIVPKINLEKLASSLEREDPELIAWTLSYLEPQRAEKIMDRFPPEFQEEVMHHLSEMESEDF